MLDNINVVRGKKVLLVASTGGHLSQLRILADRLQLDPASPWLTFEHPQSSSLLSGRPVSHVPYISPRDLRAAIRAVPGAVRTIRKNPDVDFVISTGAALGGITLPIARLLGRKCIYIESVSRFLGPSATGRFLSHFPGVATFTQHPAWANSRWLPIESVLSEYVAVKNGTQTHVRRVFVTLGTIKPYRFDSLVNTLLSLLPSSVDVVWQLGETSRVDIPGRVYSTMSSDDFDTEVRNCDVVVAHSGVGSALRILELGKAPVLVPRRAERNEHVDDHQEQIAERLSGLGLARVAEATQLTWETMQESAGLSVVGDRGLK